MKKDNKLHKYFLNLLIDLYISVKYMFVECLSDSQTKSCMKMKKIMIIMIFEEMKAGEDEATFAGDPHAGALTQIGSPTIYLLLETQCLTMKVG